MFKKRMLFTRSMGHVSRMEETCKGHTVLGRKTENKR